MKKTLIILAFLTSSILFFSCTNNIENSTEEVTSLSSRVETNNSSSDISDVESDNINSQYESDNSSLELPVNIFESINNQNSILFNSISFFAADDKLFYLANDGFYSTDCVNQSKKIFDYYLDNCIMIDGWIYGTKRSYLNESEYGMNDYESGYLVRISSDGTKKETIVDQGVGLVYYTNKYIFFSDAFYDNINIYRCDYSGGNIKKILTAELSIWTATDDSIIYVKPTDDLDYKKMFSIDYDGLNLKEIATLSMVPNDMKTHYGPITKIMTKGNQIYYSQILVDDNLQNFITRLYKVIPNSNNQLVLSNEGLYSYVFTENRIIASSSDFKSYSLDGSDEEILYTCPEESFLSTIYYCDEQIYFCMYKDDSESIFQFDINSGEVKEVVKDLPLTGMIGIFMEMFSI